MTPRAGRAAVPSPGRDPWTLLTDGLRALPVAVPDGFPDAVRVYLDELGRWNRVGRLTGYRTLEAQMTHLVLESLMVLCALPEAAPPLQDIGSGAGVPGLVIKLARPDWAVTLLEANRRRANFLRAAGRRLQVTGLTVAEDRAESLARGPLGGRFRTVTLRAVAPGGRAERLARPFLASGGRLVLPLGPTSSAPCEAVREVVLRRPDALPWRRRFLIIDA